MSDWGKAEAVLLKKQTPCVIACRDGFISEMYYRREDGEPWDDPDSWFDVVGRAAADWQNSHIVFVTRGPNHNLQYQLAASWNLDWITKGPHKTIEAAISSKQGQSTESHP